MQLLSFQRPSLYISTQFSAMFPGWNAELGSLGAQLRKLTEVSSVQAQPTAGLKEKLIHFTELSPGTIALWKQRVSLFLSICKLTVVIPGKANPEVHIFAVVEALEEFYLCSAVNGDQLHPACLAVVFRVRPREADITTVHIVTVLAIGYRKALTHPITRGGSGWRFLWDTSVIIKGYINESIYN